MISLDADFFLGRGLPAATVMANRWRQPSQANPKSQKSGDYFYLKKAIILNLESLKCVLAIAEVAEVFTFCT